MGKYILFNRIIDTTVLIFYTVPCLHKTVSKPTYCDYYNKMGFLTFIQKKTNSLLSFYNKKNSTSIFDTMH